MYHHWSIRSWMYTQVFQCSLAKLNQFSHYMCTARDNNGSEEPVSGIFLWRFWNQFLSSWWKFSIVKQQMCMLRTFFALSQSWNHFHLGYSLLLLCIKYLPVLVDFIVAMLDELCYHYQPYRLLNQFLSYSLAIRIGVLYRTYVI